jgi:hypothetical protein
LKLSASRSLWDPECHFRSFNETAEAALAVSMRPQKWLHRFQWERNRFWWFHRDSGILNKNFNNIF